jgi:hypothetical protein
MPDNTAQLKLSVEAGLGSDPEEAAELTQQLRASLLDLDVDQVVLAQTGDAPPAAQRDSRLTGARFWSRFLPRAAS